MAAFITIRAYGFVAAIVKLDDLGPYLSRATANAAWGRVRRSLGRGILSAAPLLMKFLSVAGTAAMFLVGGSILVHGLPALAAFGPQTVPGGGAEAVFHTLGTALLNAGVGVLAGSLALAAVTGVKRVTARQKRRVRD